METKILRSMESNRIVNSVEIKHEFVNKFLELTIQESTKEESLRSEQILERKKISYGYRKSENYRQITTDEKPWNRDILGSFADLFALFELITIPFRTMSDTKEQESERETILSSEEKETPIKANLTLIIRIENSEVLNRKLETRTMKIPLSEIRRVFPKSNQMEILVYKEKERVSYKTVSLQDALQQIR
ncbi:hypothetical protein EHO59_11170 [Leptospira semungkisensis]|uniref:Uncharacterized protein n=1 Tax=Leptospira semungkisensis TaxID=2484985 RepID=A0A4R9FS57_9LEPT|nr:hypothetical protein [Leptospira semungkisensis]TGK01666.1 hypothetical protein EHO59_11170 [Leptospira semungkisensis]